MQVILSDRLLMSAKLVTPGSTVADIGCDHAHTDIWLIKNGIAKHCIACDVRKGPLEKAALNLERYGLTNGIELRLSYGLHEIEAGEVTSVIIAGMGGLLTVDILKEAIDKLPSFGELILQPQSHSYEVRKFLYENGFVITHEDMCREGDKFYNCMRAVKGRSNPLSERELMFGPVLLGGQSAVFKEYLEIEYRKAEYRLEQIEKSNDPASEERRRYFQNIMGLIRG